MFSKCKEHGWEICFLLVVFISMFIFFTDVHPLVIYDGDDWANLSLTRHFLPKWHGFNPIKVLPETLMPLVGYISGYIIMPFTKNYVNAVTFTSALIVSGFITLYIYLFNLFIGALGEENEFGNVLVCAILLLSHFYFLQQKDGLSPYLFWSINLTCYYHYLIPALLNISLVLYFFHHEMEEMDIWTGNNITNGFLIVALYLGIFSNILQSVIFAVFIGVLLFERERTKLFVPKQWKRILSENWLYSSILIVWLISLVFEASGGRARSIATAGFVSPIKDTLICWLQFIHQLNPKFLILSLPVIFLALFIAYRRRNVGSERFIKIIRISLTSMILGFVYLVLVCSKAGASYFVRSDVETGVLFWYILIWGVSLFYLLQNYPKWIVAAPLVTLYILMEVLNSPSTFMESNFGKVSPHICYAVDNNIINQMRLADQSGADELKLHVPKGDNHDNWPHPNYMGESLSNTLFRDGVISRTINIEIVPDLEMNKKYHIPVPEN